MMACTIEIEARSISIPSTEARITLALTVHSTGSLMQSDSMVVAGILTSASSDVSESG